MQNKFYNQPVVDWARQNLMQPVEIRLRFASRWARALIYLLLYLFPILILAGLIFLQATGKGTQGGTWWGILGCGFILMIPPTIIVLIGVLTRQKLVKSLDVSGVKSSLGRKFLWENLYYIDHVSKHSRIGGVGRVVKDNQLELVFAEGKAIIPPLIYNREQIWALINSMPVQVRDDGQIRPIQTSGNLAGTPTFDEIVKEMMELKAQNNRNK